MPCSDTQNYKMLGNGWTIEVIKHILSHIPEIARGELIEVLSMYDGMSCGQIALKELGANVVRYYATEIDKYAIQTTQANFPDTIQLGDAFQVREENWKISGGVKTMKYERLTKNGSNYATCDGEHDIIVKFSEDGSEEPIYDLIVFA